MKRTENETIDWLNYIHDMLLNSDESPDGHKEDVLKMLSEITSAAQMSDEYTESGNDIILGEAYESYSELRAYVNSYLGNISQKFDSFDNLDSDTLGVYDKFAESKLSEKIDISNYDESAIKLLGNINMLHFSEEACKQGLEKNVEEYFYYVYSGMGVESFTELLPDKVEIDAYDLYAAAKLDIKCSCYAKKIACKILENAMPDCNIDSEAFQNTLSNMDISYIRDDTDGETERARHEFLKAKNQYIVRQKFAYKPDDTGLSALWMNPSLSLKSKYALMKLAVNDDKIHQLYQLFCDEITSIDCDKFFSSEISQYTKNYNDIAYTCSLIQNIDCLSQCEIDNFDSISRLREILLPVINYFKQLEAVYLSPYSSFIDLDSLTNEQVVNALLDDADHSDYWVMVGDMYNSHNAFSKENIEEGRNIIAKLLNLRFADTLFAKPKISRDELFLVNRGLKKPGSVTLECYEYICSEIMNAPDRLYASDDSEVSYYKALSLVGRLSWRDMDLSRMNVGSDVYDKYLDICKMLDTLDGDISEVLEQGQRVRMSPELFERNNRPKSQFKLDRSAYYSEFVRLSKAIKNISLDSDDETEYIIYKSDMEKTLSRIGSCSDSEFSDILYDSLKQLQSDRDLYLKAVIDADKLSNNQLLCIKYMNRFCYLLYQIDNGVERPNDSDDAINDKLIEKVLFVCLSEGVNGLQKNLYRNHLTNVKEMYEAGIEFMEIKPFVQAYNRPISMSDRAKLMKMSGPVVVKTVCKALKKTPKDILAYIDAYDDITK